MSIYRVGLLIIVSEFLLLVSCRPGFKASNSGVVTFQLKFYDTTTNTFQVKQNLFPPNKVWFMDSFAIEEIPVIRIESYGNGPQTTSIKILHYTFIDLRTRHCYDYRSFSDTAIPIKEYTLADSLAVPGGSPYFANLNVPEGKPSIVLPDTIIQGTKFERILFRAGNPERDKPDIQSFFRCDKKGSIISFFRMYTEKSGCPMAMYIEAPWKINRLPLMANTEYVERDLSKQEKKVFLAWKKRNKHARPMSSE